MINVLWSLNSDKSMSKLIMNVDALLKLSNTPMAFQKDQNSFHQIWLELLRLSLEISAHKGR